MCTRCQSDNCLRGDDEWTGVEDTAEDATDDGLEQFRKKLAELEARVEKLEREKEADRKTITKLEEELREAVVRGRAGNKVWHNYPMHNSNKDKEDKDNKDNKNNLHGMDVGEGLGGEEFGQGTDIREYRINKDTVDRSKTLVVRGLTMETTEDKTKDDVVKAVKDKLEIDLKVKEVKLMKPRPGGTQTQMVAVVALETAEQVQQVLKEKRKLGDSPIRLFADIPREERERLRRERMARRGGGQFGGSFGSPQQGLAELLLNLLQQAPGQQRGRPGNGGRPYPQYHPQYPPQYRPQYQPRYQRSG